MNEHTPGQDVAVLVDMAPIHISAETKQMLQEEFGHIRVIMIPPHTTNFLQPCDVGMMRPLKSTMRRTACENYARAIYNNTDDIGIVQPTAFPDLRITEQRVARFCGCAGALDVGRHRQASPSDASRLGHCPIVLQCMFFFFQKKRNDSLCSRCYCWTAHYSKKNLFLPDKTLPYATLKNPFCVHSKNFSLYHSQKKP